MARQPKTKKFYENKKKMTEFRDMPTKNEEIFTQKHDHA